MKESNNDNEKLRLFSSAEECEQFVNSWSTIVGDSVDESKLTRPERRRLQKSLKKLGNKVTSTSVSVPLKVLPNTEKQSLNIMKGNEYE